MTPVQPAPMFKPKLPSCALVLVLVVVLVLEIPDIWPSNQPNQIVAEKSGSFKVQKPTESGRA